MPLLLTTHVPGQEQGNAGFVTAAGAGRRAATVRQLVTEVARLRDAPAAVAAMRDAAVSLSRPAAAADIAALPARRAAAVPADTPPGRTARHYVGPRRPPAARSRRWPDPHLAGPDSQPRAVAF